MSVALSSEKGSHGSLAYLLSLVCKDAFFSFFFF